MDNLNDIRDFRAKIILAQTELEGLIANTISQQEPTNPVVDSESLKVEEIIEAPDINSIKEDVKDRNKSRKHLVIVTSTDDFQLKNRQSSLEDSLRTESDDPRAFQCDFCKKIFNSKRILNQHVQTHERTSSEPCPICAKQVFNVKRHLRNIHGNRKLFTCPICRMQVTRLGTHMLYKHAAPGSLLPCPFCAKKFKTRTELERHTNIHTGVKERCSFCSHETSAKNNLITHMKSKHPKEYHEYAIEKTKAQKHKICVK